ncbi:MAG: ribulose-phosphate 3-epimerase [Nitratiruptor sp.]|nr:ribulose-phosphate 3-epimerase [Nitratiruptor sp.]NPA83083.1 ribulose-phosphate 3-epimerase [Campylobacterota bacterium]
MVAPSILSADFGKLAQEVEALCEAGADLIHVDVMDGHFVPNLTIGPMVVEAVAKVASVPLDIHLMVSDNPFFVELFAPLKPRYISFHYEGEHHHHRVIQQIRSHGVAPAIAINPGTPVALLEEVVQYVDMVLLMSVNPGFGGQKFIPIYEKIDQLRQLLQKRNPECRIEVDGGVNGTNASKLRRAGVDILVAGSYIFGHEDYKEAIERLR